MTFKNDFVLSSKDQKKPIKPCLRHVVSLSVKANGNYSYHYSIKIKWTEMQ
jgi:hypothetical protein